MFPMTADMNAGTGSILSSKMAKGIAPRSSVIGSIASINVMISFFIARVVSIIGRFTASDFCVLCSKKRKYTTCCGACFWARSVQNCYTINVCMCNNMFGAINRSSDAGLSKMCLTMFWIFDNFQTRTVQKSYTQFVHKFCTPRQKQMHISVLKKESLEYLDLKEGQKVVDATLGLGGHALEIVKSIGDSGHLYAFDQDERNLVEAKKKLQDFDSRITYFHSNFVSLKTCLAEEGVTQVDSILFDLGLSSPHVDDAERGFAFKTEGPLDMRYDQRQKLTAADIVNTWSESELVEIFSKYGEERASKKVARRIVEERQKNPFETTLQLADFIRDLKKIFKEKKDSATNVFQALRIAVNDELNVLREVLPDAIEVLAPGGRIVVISYHSLEDRIVKNIFRDYSKDLEDPDEPFIHKVIRPKQVELITRKPVIPTDEEISENPRARSAKLRVIGKLNS